MRQLQLEHETLQRRLGTTHDQLQHLHGIVDAERQAHQLARVTSASELQRVSAEYGQIRESFDRLQSAFQTLEQIAGEHAAERARLETVVADRDSQLGAQAERHRVAEQDAHEALAELQERLRQAVDASGAERARLQQEIEALRREVEATWIHAEALRGVAERVPGLQTQLERSQNERRREFERAPYALCRGSERGAITDANHSFVTLLGCRRVDELRNTDFVAAALDSAGDLGWLLERARTTRKTETVETHWKTRQGRRLVVRLQALAAATGSVDIAAEDITGVRALEDRLRQAQRMEAVGRLASEVAVTCDAVLGDVARGAHEWMARVGSDGFLGPSAVPFRATLFDKSSARNWPVPWHQDTALPLQERRDVPGWGPWSLKSGITYAHAPATALSHVVALRLHFDDSREDNGPLRVREGLSLPAITRLPDACTIPDPRRDGRLNRVAVSEAIVGRRFRPATSIPSVHVACCPRTSPVVLTRAPPKAAQSRAVPERRGEWNQDGRLRERSARKIPLRASGSPMSSPSFHR